MWPDLDSEMSHYLKAKHDADEHLQASSLAYAIVRPVALTDNDWSWDVLFGGDVDPQAKAARGDVTKVLADAVDNDCRCNRFETCQTCITTMPN
jgi:uncharacterized protein YbjT (DUF2867 family)